MATTTNYGWTTPDDTALVKDGASAIRTLGSSVDTTTKALNPSTTLGDIEYRSSTANTNTRLGIGSTGQVLSVSGGVPAWATPTAGGMTLISTTTLSGASTTIGSIPSTYYDLQVIIRTATPSSDNSPIWVRMNADSTASRHRFDYSNSANLAGGTALTFGDSKWVLNQNIDNAATNGLINLEIFDYANATTWKIGRWFAIGNDGTTTTSARTALGCGSYNQTAAISSLAFSSDSGNLTGTVLLYGVK